MPEYPIRDSILTTLNAQEPWPNDVKLFQPYEVEQILLPDTASCLAVQAFLKMCNLPFEVEMRWNAEFMSPSGRVPFIKCGAFVVSELEPIAQFAANKGVSLCSQLSTEEKAEMRAYMSLITNVLVNAELYISWVDNDTFHQVTKVRNSSVYPWPLGWIQTRAKRNSVAKRLKALHWYDKTLDQVLADVEQCCNSLSQRLGDKDYFFGSPTQLDALICGHIRAILSSRGPKAILMIKTLTSSLLRLVVRIARLTDMKLTSQEEYLLSQALRLAVSRRPPRRKPSSLAGRDTGNEHLCLKPFASKCVSMLTTQDGEITCKIEERGKLVNSIGEDEYHLIVEIIEDIFDKTKETLFEKLTFDARGDDKNDFEVIAYPKDFSVSNQDPHEGGEDMIHVIDEDHDLDTDGISTGNDNEKHTNQDSETVSNLEDVPPSEMGKSLGTQDSSPTELDALVFGHVFTIITTRLPCRRLADTVKRHEALVALARRVDEHYFKRP